MKVKISYIFQCGAWEIINTETKGRAVKSIFYSEQSALDYCKEKGLEVIK